MNRWLKPFTVSAALMGLLSVAVPAHAVPVLIAGVDFEGATASTFDRTPDDFDLTDGIGVSTGSNSSIGLFSGWTLSRNDGVTAPGDGNLRNDGGANSAGATTPNFPARLESNTTGSWSIIISDSVILDLDRIEFDIRAATGASGRDGFFNTSLDGSTLLFSDTNLPGRDVTPDNWRHAVVDLSGALYQNLTDQTVGFRFITNTSGAIDLDTIRVFGTVRSAAAAVPEPASATLGLLALGGLMMRRRRMA